MSKKSKPKTTDLIIEHYQRPEVRETILKWFDHTRWLVGDNSWWMVEDGILRPRDPDRDYDVTIDQHKVVYATLNHFDRSVFSKTTTWDEVQGKSKDKIGTLQDTTAYTLGIDIDTEEGPEQKTILDSDLMREGVEAMGRYFIDRLYDAGIKNSIHCLYSGGGAYIFIHHELTRAREDWTPDQRERNFSMLTLSYNAFINETRDVFFKENPQYRGIIAVDALNNKKRVFKSIFSMHKNKKVAVIPIDKNDFRINTKAASLPLSKEVLAVGKIWYDEFDVTEKSALMNLLSKYSELEQVKVKIESSTSDQKDVEPSAYVSFKKVPIQDFPPCMLNIINNIGPKSGKTRAIATVSPFIRQSGWSEDDADTLAIQLANRSGLDPRYFWDNWQLRCANCSTLKQPGNGYPDRGIGELGFCVPDERCGTNPLNYGWTKGRKENSQVKKEASKTKVNNKLENQALKKDKELQAHKLMRLSGDAGLELWHTPDHEAYATIFVEGHGENFAIKSSSFKNWLSRLLYMAEGQVPGGQTLSDVINTMSGNAEFDGEEFETHNRLAEHDGKIYVDMGDPSWRAIEISAGSWKIINNPPVKFVRSRGMLALPEPERGGKLSDLREIINAEDESNWVLIAAWMSQAFWPRGPYAHLSISGEQGSLKTSMARTIKMIMDPSKTALRRMPRNEEELMIAAKHDNVLSVDNVSGIRKDMADGFCALATGGSFGKRALYENDEEHSITAKRPVIMNGLDAISSRNDLLDRTIVIELPKVEKRLPESEIAEKFEKIRPRIVGALLDITAAGWGKTVKRPENLPRMADFVLWVMACEDAMDLGLKPFLEVYNESNDYAINESINENRLARAIKELAMEKALDKMYRQSPTDFYNELCKKEGIERNYPPKHDWPSSPSNMVKDINRIKQGLRKQGIIIEAAKSNGKRSIVLDLNRTLLSPK